MRLTRLVSAIVAWASFLPSASTIAADAVPKAEPIWTAEQRAHWAFVPPKRAAIPAVRESAWGRNSIDAFILAELESVGLRPAAEADRATLIRRVRFDLTGVPPSWDEVERFVADDRPDAYDRLVDRLLASPECGERWARPWLDLARYSESDGFKSDKTRPNAWRYRDWVVRALNDDMPYDAFVRLQLAGDELHPGDAEAFVATGFNRNWPYEDNNKVPGLNRQLMLEDMTDTTASVFLGLTVGCARCHDHKFDPISQKDYYRLQAVFAASAPDDHHPLADSFTAAEHQFRERAHQERVAALRRTQESIERPYLAALLKDKLAKLPAEVRKAFETDPEKRSAFQEDLLEKHARSMAVDRKTMRSAMPADRRERWESVGKAMEELARQAPRTLPEAAGMTDEGASAPPVFLLFKGNFTQPREEVAPGFPSVLATAAEFARWASPDVPPSSADCGPRETATGPARGTGRRTALASWLTGPEHPLTARVMVNRLWQGHFGRGIVATPSDFGTQGAGPTHAGLLDWLATEFSSRGWSMKEMHRLMVTSATYRQSSLASEESRRVDPDNQLLSHMTRRRLEGEAVRDALLAVSGQLDRRVGGPSVFPDLPPGVQTRGGWDRSPSAADRDRRSIYVFARRNLKYPLFDAFDAPDSNVTCPERNISVNAPQALMLLNSDLVLDNARSLARQVEAAARDDAGRVDLVYRTALARDPGRDERDRAVAFLKQAPQGSGEALVDFCHAILNLNEFVFVD